MLKVPGVELYINAPMTGIIMMDTNGAVGKTYASKLLKGYAAVRPDDALVLTFDKDRTTEDYLRLITKFKGTFLFLDRYDLYEDDRITEALSKLHCYRFVDAKNTSFWNKVSPLLCETILEMSKVTISLI